VSTSPTARLRFLTGALLLLSALQTGALVATSALAPGPRSCVVPMPCCERGFCPLHAARGASHHPGEGARWLRCDDDAPLVPAPTLGPLAVLARAARAALPDFAHALPPPRETAPPSAVREPELHPPESRA
jgi:hypothetical protein